MLFYKVKNYNNEPYWVKEGIQKGEVVWVNMRGGWCPKTNEDNVIEIANYPDESSFIEAHRKDIYSYLIIPDSDLGWLAPDGTFYGCDWASHNDVAVCYFGKSDFTLEKEGWIKIFRSVELGEPVYCQSRMSPQQRVWIEDHNITFHYC